MLGDKVLQMLKEEIPKIEYERYIKQLSFDEDASKADIAVYKAPNLFVANWVKTKYKEKIAQLFELQTGIETSVEIVTSNQKTATKKVTTQEVKEHTPSTTSTKINPTYTFENFVVGSSNQFAYTAALSVAEKPGKAYNPLFIYGGVGLGKTHLLHAIGNFNIKKEKVVIYATIEQFMNDFTYHLRNKTIERFREKYRQCDILLIDDVQFLSGKERTQEEFFHTFNELHNDKKQIVLTSDQHPKKIAGLEDRLKSRFEWGLIADIQPPELETKIAIIKKKCELDGINLDDEIINYIASHMDSNIREIEGVIIKLNAYSSLVNQKITLDLAKNVLGELKKEQQKNITLKDIVDAVASDLNIKPSEIKSKSRSRQIVNARRIVIYLARTLTPNSMPALAQFFGMKDHTSVSHAMKKVKEMIEKDANFKLKIDELAHKIRSSNSEKM
ncbi:MULTISPECIES: chromosomal replication initiator protein DnaA [unclassified Nitratiruptor]|uniref:chromosomal replication initiator protein DnaA n=1 Tax=unclassified Nitratiruptor TaxID=2624044 RepID=UPI00191502AD|nr:MULTISPECIES: chromosomal replication initiator protein DnaA [unclassified Nitratiruptor]BCD59271.1 chromosomal replication initiator protein [Nitratiruptor sp. YY08-10]BCD63195.1 chromosomal replication initiator protein [Nitratiruptor sp. YY08-14]